MPDHVHLFIRGGPDFVLSAWIGGLKRALSVALKARQLWQPGFFDHILRRTKATVKNGTTYTTILFAPVWWKREINGDIEARLS
jgi:REP element-mobilizing transposase RayT